MRGEAEVLRLLVEACLDNDSCKRPSILRLSEKIKPLKERVTCHEEEENSSAIEGVVCNEQNDGKNDASLLPKNILLKPKRNLKIKVRHAKILFCGTSQAGKTSFINFLKNVKINEYKSSKLSQKVLIKGKEWIDLHDQLEIEELVNHLFHQNIKLDELDLSLQKADVGNEMVDVEKMMIASFTNVTKGELSETWNILTLLDIGCQPELINMLSSMNDSAAVTFVVLNISKGIECLDLPVDVPNKKYRKCRPTPNHSNAYLLKCLLSLIKESVGRIITFPKIIQLDADQLDKPIVCFLGTFCDLLKKSLQSEECFDDAISALSKKITNDLIRTINNDNSLCIWNYDGEVVIPFDNTVSEETQHEHRVIKEFRSIIFDDILQEKKPYEIPFPWFILELQIRQKNKPCLLLKEVETISNTIMPEDEKIDIMEFLRFYHLLGVLLYFEVDFLKDFIITNPQWLYNNLMKLVTCEFAEKKILDEKLDDFRYKGIFHASLLKAFHLDTRGIERKYFLDLLVHLKICAPYNNRSNTYYMPTALPTYKWSYEQNSLHENIFGNEIFYSNDNSCVVEPLQIQFNIHTIPRGMFCWLVVQLQEENLDWILYSNDQSTEIVYQYDNLVTFRMSSGFHYLSLLDKVYCIEMQVRTKNSEPSEAFFEAKRAVTTAIESICGKFGKRITDLQYGFLCTCPNPATEHLTFFPQNFCITGSVTADCGKQMLKLTPSHKVWFGSLKEMLSLMQLSKKVGHGALAQPSQQAKVHNNSLSVTTVDDKLKEKPTPQMVSLFTDYILPDWIRIGYQLFDSKHVQRIVATNKSDVDKCLDMLIQWLDTDTSATYSKLVDVLIRLDHNNSAEQIKNMVLKDCTINQ